jgi:hypothetical protein
MYVAASRCAVALHFCERELEISLSLSLSLPRVRVPRQWAAITPKSDPLVNPHYRLPPMIAGQLFSTTVIFL